MRKAMNPAFSIPNLMSRTRDHCLVNESQANNLTEIHMYYNSIDERVPQATASEYLAD